MGAAIEAMGAVGHTVTYSRPHYRRSSCKTPMSELTSLANRRQQSLVNNCKDRENVSSRNKEQSLFVCGVFSVNRCKSWKVVRGCSARNTHTE